MRRAPLHVLVRVSSLHCEEGADLSGASEPYLWVICFKVDGESLTVSDPEHFAFAGEATVDARIGGHGNLGVEGVHPGEDVAIPEDLGLWHTTLLPIAVMASARGDAAPTEVPGGVGVLCVLREADEADDARSEALGVALAKRVQATLDGLVASRGPKRPGFPEEEVRTALEAGLDRATRDGDQWVINPDDTLGARVWFFPHDQLAKEGGAALAVRWELQGSWTLSGTVAAAPRDPLEALASATARASTEPPRDGRWEPSTLRAFRDRVVARGPGLSEWWELCARNAAFVTAALARDPALVAVSEALLRGFTEAVEQPTRELPDLLLGQARRLALEAAREGTSESREDASQVTAALTRVRGLSLERALSVLEKETPGMVG